MGAPATTHWLKRAARSTRVTRSAVRSATVRTVTVLQTIGVYVLIPLAVFGVLALFTLWPKIARGPRYRPGQEWPHEPMWWIGNPDGIGRLGTSGTPGAEHGGPATTTARGGARGSW